MREGNVSIAQRKSHSLPLSLPPSLPPYRRRREAGGDQVAQGAIWVRGRGDGRRWRHGYAGRGGREGGRDWKGAESRGIKEDGRLTQKFTSPSFALTLCIQDKYK